MADPILRIYPSIGMARVGNSVDYYIAPETMAGEPQAGTALTGGLPIKPGTLDTPITSADLRDGEGGLKRQAARFRIYDVPDAGPERYPSGQPLTEVVVGSTLGGKTVKDIVWTVHLANKKAACWDLDEAKGLAAYAGGNTPALRNPNYPTENAADTDPKRLADLIIDAGPHSVAAKGTAGASSAVFRKGVTPTLYTAGQGIQAQADYPVQYPSDAFAAENLYTAADTPQDMPTPDGALPPAGESISYLGEISTDAEGRLLVLGGFGKATGFRRDPSEDFVLTGDVNNDHWFDDTSDGPVTATVVFDDDTTLAVQSPGWVVVTDPSYAPQIRNAVSLWDDIYHTWVQEPTLALQPELYADGTYNTAYTPSFEGDIRPVFLAAGLQQWATNLNSEGIDAHTSLTKVTAATPPDQAMSVKAFIRDPNNACPIDDGMAKGCSTNITAPKMPLSLGDAGYAMLTLTQTQFFFLKQWEAGKITTDPGTPLNAGELLDKATLVNCLGGRFNPGIDLTFIVRDPNLYRDDWQKATVGPFRINAQPLDYAAAKPGVPFLGVGYQPLDVSTKVEPGDLCKFMAIPWHTDYNSCATHVPSPNPGGPLTDASGQPVKELYDGRNLTTFWSWPAQRPVATYTFEDLSANNGTLPAYQRFCVRGTGTPVAPRSDTNPFPAMEVGRYQDRINILVGWDKVGFILQAPAIDGYQSGWDSKVESYYLETANRLTGPSDAVDPYPVTVVDPVRLEG